MPDVTIATRECVVYWLFDEKCVCIWRHGYVGISENWPGRLALHRQKFPGGFQSQVLFRGTRLECQKLEYKLRPESLIGWNTYPGGGKQSEEARAKHRLRMLGTTNKGRIGQKKSDAERAKISASQTGKVRLNPGNYARYGNTSHLGYTHTEATKERIRKTKTGVPIHSEQEKEKRRQRMKGNALTKGKPWSAARRIAWLSKLKPTHDA